MAEVYILHSKSLNRFYIGFSMDLQIRMEFHRNPEKRKFTAKAEDWELYLQIKYPSREQAMAIEKHIKRMKSSVYISSLKKYPEITEKLLCPYSTFCTHKNAKKSRRFRSSYSNSHL